MKQTQHKNTIVIPLNLDRLVMALLFLRSSVTKNKGTLRFDRELWEDSIRIARV